ncbi:MAG: UDP-N-acetylglucosamine 2-epimerase [Nanoarchaeota archaeon]
MGNKLVLIENKDQASEYVKNKTKFGSFKPITLHFEAEEILKKKGIKFLTEADYEKDFYFEELNEKSLLATNKICKEIDFRYKGISLLPLFHYKVCTLVTLAKVKLSILAEIIKKENPTEILLFRESKLTDESNTGFILRKIFNKKITCIEYESEKISEIRDSLLIRLGGLVQQIIASLRIKFSKKEDNKIFISGPQTISNSVIELLLEDKKNKIIHFGERLSKSFFIDNKYIPFYQFYKKKEPIFTYEEKLKILLLKIENYNFPNIDKEIVGALREELKELLKNNVKASFSWIDEIEELARRKKIDLVLLSEDTNQFAKTIVEATKVFKIPSIVFMHGILSMKIDFVTPTATYVFVFGKRYKTSFVKNGADKNRIIPIGCPRYDLLTPQQNRKKTKKIIYLMEVANKDILVPGTHLTEKDQKMALRAVFNVLKKFPEYSLILKIRPGWDMAGLPRAVAEEEGFSNFEVIEKTDNTKLINDSDIVIINHTTMGLEALLLDKPTICFTFRNLESINPYKDTPAIDKVFDAESLEKSIRKCLNQTTKDSLDRQESLKKHFDILDRKASERAVNFIKNILSKKASLNEYFY